jgi:formate/nitrite transporter FocA (FNT family)
VQQEQTRATALDIYERVCDDARDEIKRPWSSLAYSGLFAGFTIGAAPAAYAMGLASLEGAAAAVLVAALLYPVGYVAVILGRGSFFTENTLYPVVLTLRDSSALRGTARLWGIVYATNQVGAFLFALLIVATGVLAPSAEAQFLALGDDALGANFGDVFWAGVVTGWLLALVAWLVESAEHAVAQIAVIWALTFLVALGSFDHSIASSVTAMASVLDGGADAGEWVGWLAAATLGNIAGGIGIVSLINYGQVRKED